MNGTKKRGRSDSLANARRLKCLAVADDFTHESVSTSRQIMASQVATQHVIRSGSSIQRLSASDPNRWRTGIHQPGISGMGARKGNRTFID